MSGTWGDSLRRNLPAAISAAVFEFVVASSAPLSAADGDSPQIVRVEEDWALVVGTPDPDTNAPQVVCVFAPTADVDYGYAEFDVNHHSQPTYVPGGLQLQVWSNGRPIVVNNDPDGGVIATPSEQVTWTQSMTLDNGVLTFAVTGGQSNTWGTFGNDGRLQLRTAAALTDLNGYDTAVSVTNSGIGYASNRVSVLKITAVRRYTADGRVLTDDAPHVVFQHD
jgi:hypothetical protein